MSIPVDRALLVMRTPARLFIASLLLAVSLDAARAAPVPVEVTQTFRLANPPGLVNPPLLEFSIEASGTAEVSSSAAAFTLPASLLVGTARFPDITEGAGQPVRSASFSAANARGSFGPGNGPAGGFGGPMEILGDVVLRLRVGLGAGTQSFPLAGLGLDSTFVQTGSVTFRRPMGTTFFVPGTVTLRGQDWTTGVVTATARNTAPSGTMFTGTQMATGYDERTPAGLGTLQLVTPILVSSRITLEQPGVAVLTVTFVPEPGRVSATFAGFVAALWIGRHLARARSRSA